MAAIKDIRLERYREFQRRQREALRTSQHRQPSEDGSPDEPTSATDQGTGAKPFGAAGRPFNRFSPFYIGFVGAFGALIAIGLWHAVGRLTTTITILLVAFFLTLALNPMVERLTERGLQRGGAVGVVFAGVLVVFALLGVLVIPPVITEGSQLLSNAPQYVDSVLGSPWVRRLDENYDVVDKLREEINSRLVDPQFISRIFGGMLGAGKILVFGVFQTFTILILSLYFLASFPTAKKAAYDMLPASRRPRVRPLSEEIMKRTGAYAIGQASVATINAVLSYVMMRLLGVPYAAVLAVVVGFLGLIPMVGATIGAVLVGLVAFFDEPRSALVVGIYYLIYQQVENYVIVPKIMARTVSVPGAVTVVAALAGGTLLGVLGALLAIPVAAGLLLLYEEVLVPRQRRS